MTNISANNIFYVLLHNHTHKAITTMRHCIRMFLCLCALAMASAMTAQTTKWQDLYKVKKKDTIYGIAKKYNITIDELMRANPDMQKADYSLKKGDQLLIPYPKATQPTAKATQPTAKANTTKANAATMGTVNVGVMLPLHNADGDGQRMLEYYRGVLMACDSLKAQGISTHVYAWDVPIDANVQQTVNDDNARKCDIIFGPLYSSQVKTMGDFCRKNDIRLVIPFSISGGDVNTNDHIFQVYQTPTLQNEEAVKAFVERFGGRHVVIIDCNDATTGKGAFTTALRKRMDELKMSYNLTNLKSTDAVFANAFSTKQRNVVVLNTARSPELNATLARLNTLTAANKAIGVSLFGYTEWLMYTKVYADYYHRYDAYIPTTFYYNPAAAGTAALERAYRQWFGSDMRQALPRFAITGYDHAQFFIRGMHKYGRKFRGTQQQNSYRPMQTPLKFKYVQGGGMQNTNFMLVHYKTNHTLESISY